MISYENNILYIDGCSAVDLAEEYGTPLLVLSEDHIRSKCREISETFLTRYPGTRAAYAAKAFLCLEMCRIIQEEGLCLDVVSGGELYVGLQSGMPAERMSLHGNNKSRAELKMAIDAGTWVINPEKTINVHIGGKLPLQEGLFFLLTNVLITFGSTLALSQQSLNRVPKFIRPHLLRALRREPAE